MWLNTICKLLTWICLFIFVGFALEETDNIMVLFALLAGMFI